MNPRQELLARLPSVDEVLRSPFGEEWLRKWPRQYVLLAIREAIDLRRREILEGTAAEAGIEELAPAIEARIGRLASYSLRQVINATGVVIHTNLGRAPLSERALRHVERVAAGYSNLEYDIEAGKRGKRYAHIRRLIREVTGAEDGFAVNNNAAAVLLCLSALARGREVIVSRGELVEIGGSFRVPDVMAQSGAILREVGTTNKTHRKDYDAAISGETALILKVHQSNYRIIGFTEDVAFGELAGIGRQHGVTVMYDLGSGCLTDLRPYGIHSEPTVQEVLRGGVDLVTFSGDKLLGGPQAGIIVGRKELIERIQSHPLTRAVRIDKLTLAALEATLMEYVEEDLAKKRIPALRMLLEEPGEVRGKAKRIAAALRRSIKDAEIGVTEASSHAGGGSLPEKEFRTFAVSVRSGSVSANELEERLRHGDPPVIARIQDDALLLDPRTVLPGEVTVLIQKVREALR